MDLFKFKYKRIWCFFPWLDLSNVDFRQKKFSDKNTKKAETEHALLEVDAATQIKWCKTTKALGRHFSHCWVRKTLNEIVSNLQ